MIGSALRYEIEFHAARVRADNPLLRSAAAGRAPAAAIERYLASLRYMVAASPPCLARAAKRARDLGQPALADHFAAKCGEETGHDQWAENDLIVLRSTFPVDNGDGPVPSIVELLEFLEETIDRQPALYLAYVLWAEYFTVLLGGELIGYLVQRCGMPPEALTCVAKHVELDKDHAAEGIEVIDALVTDPRMLGPLRAVLRHAMQLFDRACVEMMDVPLARAAS